MNYVLSDGYNSFSTGTVGDNGDRIDISIESGDTYSTTDSNVIQLLNASPFVQKKPATKTTTNKDSK